MDGPGQGLEFELGSLGITINGSNELTEVKEGQQAAHLEVQKGWQIKEITVDGKAIWTLPTTWKWKRTCKERRLWTNEEKTEKKTVENAILRIVGEATTNKKKLMITFDTRSTANLTLVRDYFKTDFEKIDGGKIPKMTRKETEIIPEHKISEDHSCVAFRELATKAGLMIEPVNPVGCDEAAGMSTQLPRRVSNYPEEIHLPDGPAPGITNDRRLAEADPSGSAPTLGIAAGSLLLLGGYLAYAFKRRFFAKRVPATGEMDLESGVPE